MALQAVERRVFDAGLQMLQVERWRRSRLVGDGDETKVESRQRSAVSVTAESRQEDTALEWHVGVMAAGVSDSRDWRRQVTSLAPPQAGAQNAHEAWCQQRSPSACAL